MIRKEPLDGGLAVYRDTDRPGYTADSLLLVRFARVKRTDRVIDLGSGTGILALYGQSLYGGEWAGVEADPEQAALAARSAEENGQAIPFYAMDVREAPAFFGEGSFTAAVCNPPYFDPASPNPSEAFRAARHAGAEELGAFFAAAFRLLKNRGRIFLCCPAGAVSRFCALLEANRLVPKRFRRVRAAEGKPPYLLLIEAVKLGGDGAVWEEDLVLPAAEKAPEALETRAADGIIHKTDPRSGGEDGGKA